MAFLKLLGIIAIGLLLFYVGLGTVMPVSNKPADYKIALITKKAGEYKVQVVVGPNCTTFPVGPDGQTTIHVPVIPKSCSLVWFWITVVDRSPENRRVISIIGNGQVVRKLSLRQLESMPRDSETYKIKP